jgi:3-isopropylmalate dehydratase small subunit
MEPYRREMLLRGLDEIGRTLLEEPRIAAFEKAGPSRLRD